MAFVGFKRLWLCSIYLMAAPVPEAMPS
jgi:hypothetical protein